MPGRNGNGVAEATPLRGWGGADEGTATEVPDERSARVAAEDYSDVDAEDGDEMRRAVLLPSIDVLALAGTAVSTSAIAIVGIAEVPTAVLALPVVLPMVALIAYRERAVRRQRLAQEASARQLRQEVRALREEMAGAVSASVASALEGGSLPAMAQGFGKLESKVSNLEGSILAATRLAHDSARRLEASRARALAAMDGDAIATRVEAFVAGKLSELDAAANRDGPWDAAATAEMAEAVREALASETAETAAALSDLTRGIAALEASQSRIADESIAAISQAFEDANEDLLRTYAVEAEVVASGSTGTGGGLGDAAGAGEGVPAVPAVRAVAVGEDFVRAELSALRESMADTLESLLEEGGERSLRNVERGFTTVMEDAAAHAERTEATLDAIRSAILEASPWEGAEGMGGGMGNGGEVGATEAAVLGRLDDVRADVSDLALLVRALGENVRVLEEEAGLGVGVGGNFAEKSLPALVEGIACEVKQSLRQYQVEVSTFQGAVSRFTAVEGGGGGGGVGGGWGD